MVRKIILTLLVVGNSLAYAANNDTLLLQKLKAAMQLEKSGQYKSAVALYDTVLQHAVTINDTQKIIECAQLKGVTFSKMSQPDSALANLFKALTMAEKNGSLITQARLNKNIGAVYVEQKDYQTALKHYNKAKIVAQTANDTLLTADLLNNIGLVIEVQGNPKEGLSYYLKAYQWYKKLKNEQRVALAANNIAIVYKNEKNFEQAERYLREALAITEKSGDTWTIAANYVNFGNALFGNGKRKEAETYTRKAIDLASKIPAWEIVAAAYHNLSDYAEKSGDFATALDMFKKKQQYDDSLIIEERMQQMAEIREKYEAEKREGTIRLLEQEREIQQLKIEQQSLAMAKQNTWWAAAVLLVIVMGVSAFWVYNNKKLKEKALYEASLMRKESEKQLAIFEAERAERTRIARDMHDELGSGLSKIALLTAQVQAKTVSDIPLNSQVENISKTARQLVSNLSDLVWALNVGDSKLDFLIARMREFVFDYLEECAIPFQARFPDYVPDVDISKEVQRNLFLCFKETINNTVKHSKATLINIDVSLVNHVLQIIIKDNGVGFDMANARKNGNGLKNLQKRMEHINGAYSINSTPGTGTVSMFSLDVKSSLAEN